MHFYKIYIFIFLNLLFNNLCHSQNFTNGDFSTGNDGSWLGSIEINVETPYGGLNASNRVGEIDSSRFLRQNVTGFTINQTYVLSYKASRRETVDCNNGTPNPINMIIMFDGVAKDSITRTNTTFDLTSESYTFTATATTHNIRFSKGALNVTTCGVLIDDVSISVSLPVTFTRISAKAINEKMAVIEWSTASESNNNFFTIESSTDGTIWKSISKVKGYGTTNSPQNYKYVDTNIVGSALYYRITQTDFDGKTSASKVCFLSKSSTSNLKIYPNPSNTHLIHLDCIENTTNHVSIFDMEGKLVYSDENMNSDTLDLSNLPNGLYEIIIQNENNIQQSHFVLN